MKKYKLHRDLIEAALISLGIIIAFSALAFTSVNKPTIVNKKIEAIHAINPQPLSPVNIRLCDEKGNILSETKHNGASVPQKMELIMPIQEIGY